jgi:hypothetical protein
MLLIPKAILEAVPEGPLTRPAAACKALLEDPARSAMVIVTLAEDMPSNEAIELSRRAQGRVGVPLGPLVVNSLYPPRFSQGVSAHALRALPEAVGDPQLEPLIANARTAERRRALNDRYLERLRRDLPLPQIHLPYLFTPDFGPAAIDELSRRLEGQVRSV